MKYEMRSEIVTRLEEIFHDIGIDRPNNFDTIVDFIKKDVVETADEDYSISDFDIAFRRWIERD